MEQIPGNNIVRLVGTAAGRPTLSHESRGEAFYRLPLSVRRLSGAEDELPLLLRRSLLERLELREADKLCVSGELRSFNNRSGEGAEMAACSFSLACGRRSLVGYSPWGCKGLGTTEQLHFESRSIC